MGEVSLCYMPLGNAADEQGKKGKKSGFEPQIVSIVNIPVFNKYYPSQLHREALFRAKDAINRQTSKKTIAKVSGDD